MKKIRIIALLSAVVMFASLFMILTNMARAARENEQRAIDNSKKITVVKAAQDIPPYTVITENMLEIKKISTDDTFDDYFEKKEDVIGRIAVSDIFKGDVVTSKRIAAEENTALGLAYRIKEGMRAITLNVNIEQGVANTLKVGNFVDIIFAGTFASENNGGTNQKIPAGIAFDAVLGERSPANSQILHDRVEESFAAIAMQNVKVLSLDDKFFRAKADPTLGNAYGSVTLEVTPAQATQLVLLKQNYTAYLVLRNQNDNEIINEPRGEVFQPYTPSGDR